MEFYIHNSISGLVIVFLPCFCRLMIFCRVVIMNRIAVQNTFRGH